jgi:inosine/xanthosine triphosphate pyrophosphatase family protein/dephospho-CoA kinase
MRPQYGDVFRFDRMLNVFFYTSNTDKLIQARLIFMRSGYQLRHYRSQYEPYEEDYSQGTRGLLTKALKQVSQDFDVRSMFFVEDTSLRLEALSEVEDYPGTRVKEWFAATSFDELAKQIRLRGGNRRAIVKSDIALRIPTLSRPIFFHAETSGLVALEPPTFTASVPYPWLTPETFNGWFIPDGSTKRLGEMEFEESLEFDFRAKALGLVIERVEELTAAVNFGTRHHITRRMVGKFGGSSQMSLFPVVRGGLLVVIGNKCAGKSTLSDFLTGQLQDIFVLEASTLLRNLAAEDNTSVVSSNDALAYLQAKGWDVVAQAATSCITREGARLNIVTGLRTTEELLHVRRAFPQTKVVLVEADQRTRFERHIRRARAGDARSFREFQAVDEEQARFGAMRVAHEICDIVIRNDEDIHQYQSRIKNLLDTAELESERRPSESELRRSIRALNKIGHAATCDEIAQVTADQGHLVRKYNNNRALKSVPEFAIRIEKGGQLLKYRLSNRGRALLDLLEISRNTVATG